MFTGAEELPNLDPTTVASIVSSLVTPSVVVWLVVTGKLVRGVELEKSQEQNKALQDAMVEQVIPALTRATDTLRDATPVVQDAVALRRTQR